MTGPTAQVGNDAKTVVELYADIVNTTQYKDLNVPLAGAGGLPGLGGAKVVPVFADHQGSPEKGAAEAERLITQEKVVAIFGAYQSSVSAGIAKVTEKYGIPFMIPESSSPTLNRLGYKWLFRTTPHDELFSKAMFDLMADFEKKQNVKLETIAIFHENTLFGSDSAKAQQALAQERGKKVVEVISYNPNATSFTAEVQKLKAANADVLLPTGYTSDAILFLKTAKELDYNPKMVIAQDAGYIEPDFQKAVGRDADGIMSRGVFSLDLAAKKPLVKQINDLYKQRSGKDLADNSAREFVGFMTLVDAINRAKSTDPEAIRKALAATDIPADKLILAWKGIKFDETGLNIYGQAIINQYQEGKLRLVWPFDVAVADIIYPIPKWSERK
jgi:branched-chain amino acid transport system substrate-binding protein